MKNILLIVDPQNDFITGTLAVEGAKLAMSKLTQYIEEKGDKYDYIFITMDTHPENHSSFIDNGGQWPNHCVKDTTGWRISEDLELALRGRSGVGFFFKGNISDKEEYSIFDNERDGAVLAYKLNKLVKTDSDTYIDICGIAGDYCVLETLKGLTEIIDSKHISILGDFIASIDCGEKLETYSSENGINYITDITSNLDTYVY